ncbi:MAG TPA: hypothetical protein VLH86_00945 [Patescibacteria group bacterium]|nr:hypothetical protein [Patescibacteria group bacterium]
MGETFQPYTNSKKWFVGIGVVLCIAVAALVIYFAFIHKQPKPAAAPYNAHREQINSLERQTVPTDPSQQLSYYSQLAQHYEDLNNRDDALKNYLKAQKVADDNKLTQIAFYMPIANLYKQRGDKTNAKMYFEKEIGYLNQFVAEHPEQATSIGQTITAVEEQIKEL